jgi:hypothetical protein
MYLTMMPGNSRKLLGVIVLTDPNIERDAEAYRYAMLDATVLDKPTSEPPAGRYAVSGTGSIGGSTEGPEFVVFRRLLTEDFIVFNKLQAARSPREKSARFLRAPGGPK